MSAENKSEVPSSFAVSQFVLSQLEIKDSEEPIQGLDEEDVIIHLLSKKNNPENTIVDISSKLAKRSIVIEKAMENKGLDDDRTIEFEHVSLPILRDVVEYLTITQNYSVTIEKPLKSADPRDFITVSSSPVPPQDLLDFLAKLRLPDLRHLYDLILAANNLDIPDLLNLGCAYTAALIKGQPLEKINGILNPNTPQDRPNVQNSMSQAHVLPIRQPDAAPIHLFEPTSSSQAEIIHQHQHNELFESKREDDDQMY